MKFDIPDTEGEAMTRRADGLRRALSISKRIADQAQKSLLESFLWLAVGAAGPSQEVIIIRGTAR